MSLQSSLCRPFKASAHIYSVVCFGEQKNFLIGNLKLSFGLGMMFILLDMVTDSIKY